MFEFARTPNEAQKILHRGRMMSIWRRTIRYSDQRESVERIAKIWGQSVYTSGIATRRYFIASIIIIKSISTKSDLSRFVSDNHEQILYDIREVTNDYRTRPRLYSFVKFNRGEKIFQLYHEHLLKDVLDHL